VLLKRKMKEKKMTGKEAYEGAGIDRKLFSKINTNDGYHPNRKIANNEPSRLAWLTD
jgi:hypothetical protein